MILKRITYFSIIMLFIASCKLSDKKNQEQAEDVKYDSITEILKSQKDDDGPMNTVDTSFEQSKGASLVSTKYEPPEKIDNTKFAVRFYRKGIKEFEKRNYALGIEEFRKVTQMKPNHKGAWYNLALGRYMLKDYENALDDFKMALEIDPQDTTTVLYIGLSYYYMQDIENAIDWFDSAISMNPEFSNAYFNRGTAKGQLNDYQGAIADLNTAIEINPNYTDAYMNRGNAYYFMGKTEEACRNWKKAKSLGSTQVDEVLRAYCSGGD